jgi:4-carboxymuconolactone decarboxylase
MDEKEIHANGMVVRRAVLGDAHVDRAQAGRTEFNTDFQDLITRYAWGEIWTRPGLPRNTLHLRAASNNGVTRDEIKEVLMQAAIYCGVPAANSAFHMAQALFQQIDLEAGK